MAVGNPAKVIRELKGEQIEWETKGTKYYQKLPSVNHNFLNECTPLSHIENDRPEQISDYHTWDK